MARISAERFPQQSGEEFECISADLASAVEHLTGITLSDAPDDPLAAAAIDALRRAYTLGVTETLEFVSTQRLATSRVFQAVISGLRRIAEFAAPHVTESPGSDRDPQLPIVAQLGPSLFDSVGHRAPRLPRRTSTPKIHVAIDRRARERRDERALTSASPTCTTNFITRVSDIAARIGRVDAAAVVRRPRVRSTPAPNVEAWETSGLAETPSVRAAPQAAEPLVDRLKNAAVAELTSAIPILLAIA